MEDNCDNFENPAIANLTDGKVANMKTADSAMNFHKFQDSTYDSVTDGRMIKAADQNAAETDKSTYIVYHAAENMNSFHVETYYCKKNGKLANDMSFEASPDGVTYTPIPKADITRTVAETTINGNIYNEANWADYFWRQVNFDFSFCRRIRNIWKINRRKGLQCLLVILPSLRCRSHRGGRKQAVSGGCGRVRQAGWRQRRTTAATGTGSIGRRFMTRWKNACTAAEAVLQNPEAEQAEGRRRPGHPAGPDRDLPAVPKSSPPLVDECADFDRLLSHTEANLQLSASDLALGDKHTLRLKRRLRQSWFTG